MAVVTMRELLDSGVHFGHQTRRWNPKMKRFIFTERNGIYIIDIQQSLALIDKAYEFIKDTVAKGGNVLFVGTKKQAHEPIISQSARVGMPYVTERWLGGMLTNFPTVYKRIQRLKELEALESANDQLLTKKELLVLRREREKLTKNLQGIRDMTKVPAAIWVVDTKKEHLQNELVVQQQLRRQLHESKVQLNESRHHCLESCNQLRLDRNLYPKLQQLESPTCVLLAQQGVPSLCQQPKLLKAIWSCCEYLRGSL